VIIAPLNATPLNGTTLAINVRNSSNNPIQGASVQVIFNADIRVCTLATHTGTTNAAGDVFPPIVVTGGGCVNTAVPGACVIIANGIEIRNYTKVKSPDNGAHVTSSPSGSVTGVDFGAFAAEFLGTATIGCHDYDNNTLCNGGDLGFFGDAFKAAMTCAI